MAIVKRCGQCHKEGSPIKACKHSTATYAVHFRVNGKQVLKTIGTNRRDAERYLLNVKSEIATTGSFETMKTILFKDLAEKWYEQKQSDERRPGTLWAYRNRLDRHILPFLGKKIASQVTRSEIESLKLKLKEKLSSRSTNFVLTQLTSIFRHGVRLNFCKTNPVEFIERCKGVQKSAGSFLTTEEAGSLLEHCSEPHRTIFLTMFTTGCRIGELSALMWKDVDFRSNLIHIQRNVFFGPPGKYGMKATWVFQEPKSADGVRKVFMIAGLKAALIRHKEASVPNKYGLIFATSRGNPHDRSTLGKVLVASLERAGIKRIRPHDLRHSNASWLLSRGIDLASVSKHLGHSSVQITGDIYHHVLPEDYGRVSGVLDQSFRDNSLITLLPQSTPNKTNQTEEQVEVSR